MFRPTASTSTMAISTSPRKLVPLSSGSDWDNGSRSLSQQTGPTVTRRAFFCGVVVEGPSDGVDLSEDVQDLVASLGERLSPEAELDEALPSAQNLVSLVCNINNYDLTLNKNESNTRPRALTNTSALMDLVNELVSTERTYVQRLRILKDSYADPLRSYARSKDTAIIAPYEAKILFGNVDQLLPVNEAFLHDLEQMLAPDGAQTVGGVGDVALHHFKELRAFECYKQYYSKREEAQAIFKREMSKKSSTGFAAFVERIKYSTNDAKNRVGLRELLMEPVQRIPRYTLMFRSMIKLMAQSDPQRARLSEADEIASRIALAETDDHTRLAATLNCLASSIEGFPPALISSSRRFIDCIDVEDNVIDGMGVYSNAGPTSTLSSMSSGSSSNSSSLHCTLILFDDKLMIVKRSNTDKPGRLLAGLDDVEKFANGGFPASTRGRGLTSLRRGGMSCKGVIDITDVVATDVSGPDIHMYLETTPQDQTDRWAGRPFRVLSVVNPPYAVNHDPIRTEDDKKRFLLNLWRAQALYRTKCGQSVALCADDREVEARSGRVTIARTYFNVYQRTSFLKEAKKTKIVVHIDSFGEADPLPFGIDGPPFVVIRIQPQEGEVCKYSVHSINEDDGIEEDVLQTALVPMRIVQTIHQYGLFKFRTNNPSRPATPSGSQRSRAHIFGLDVISRNLFGALPGSSKGLKDPFGSGSIGSHKRSKSAMSRSSTIRTDTSGATTAATDDSMMKFSSRSTSTAATSMSSYVEDEDSFIGRPASKSRKLVKRSRSRSQSPGAGLRRSYTSESEPDIVLSKQNYARAAIKREQSISYDSYEGLSMTNIRDSRHTNQSELDLTMRLELARRNSKNQHAVSVASNIMDRPIEDTIYEESPPAPMRPLSRASRIKRSASEQDVLSTRSSSPHPTSRSVTPTPTTESPRKHRSMSNCSPERRPAGPRAPSPLPPTSPILQSIQLDLDGALEVSLMDVSSLRMQTTAQPLISAEQENQAFASSQIPRSRRQPLAPTGNTEMTPRGAEPSNGIKLPGGIEPLSIKKKNSTSTSHGTPNSARKSYVKDSALTRRTSKIDGRHASSTTPIQKIVPLTTSSSSKDMPSCELPDKVLLLTETTKEDVEASRRVLKKIKLEVSSLPQRFGKESVSETQQPLRSHGLTRTPTKMSAANKEALDRMDEMRALIGQRSGSTPRPRPRSVIESGSLVNGIEPNTSELQIWTKSVEELINNAERDCTRAASNCDLLESGLRQYMREAKEHSTFLEKIRTDLRSTQRQCELMKNLLADATAENEIMYEAFNEELDGMFNDANLPHDEAWSAMTADFKRAKEDRNKLAKENARLKQRLREMDSQRDEWACLLREHGLIP